MIGLHETPEGFQLPRALLLPEARSFADVLGYLGEWDYETMSHEKSNRPEPRYIPEITPPATQHERSAWRTMHGRNEVGPFCTVDMSQIGGKAHRGIAVRATDATIEALAPRIVTPDDTLSFQLIAHKGTKRVLVIASHGYILGSHWLAYIDPSTVPAYPYQERDDRKQEICERIHAAGSTPFVRMRPGGIIELAMSGIAPLAERAIILADGTVEQDVKS